MRNIRSVQEFPLTGLPAFKSSKALREKCLKALSDVADTLIDDPHVGDQAIQNFLKDCFNYPSILKYSPLNTRILVLISRLPDMHITDYLSKLSNLGDNNWKLNNSCALINRCCRTDLISEEMRKLFMEKLTGLTIDLNRPESLAEMAHFHEKVLYWGIGSRYILEFIPINLFSQMLKLGWKFRDLECVDFVVSTDQLEEFLQGKGIIYENEVMFEYTKSLCAFADWPIYINWAIYKIYKDVINMSDKKAVDLILSILQYVPESFSIELKRIAREFSKKVLEEYPDLVSNARKKILTLSDS